MSAVLPQARECCDSCIGDGVVTFIPIGWFSLDDLGALRAQPSASTNVFASVGTLGTGFIGEFYWVAGSTAADDSITVIAPNDGQAGRWFKRL